MPYISEIHFLTGDAWVEAEFVEITLGPGENPADYTLSFFDSAGSLKTPLTGSDPNSGSSSNVLTNGEVNLGSLVGLPDPDNPDFTIYILSGTIDGNKLLNGGTSNGAEANYVSLFDINSGSLVNAYGIASNPARTLSGGAADGQTATTTSGWPASGQSYHFDPFGNQTIAARSSGNAVTCFDERTRILTPKGERLLRNLRIGDLVETLDHGPQPIRWIGVTPCSHISLAKTSRLKPVRIPKDIFGPGLPNRTLRVSRQHRLLLLRKPPSPLQPTDGILIPAIRLTDRPGINVQRVPQEITYRHLLFGRHEIICANGIPAESFLARSVTIAALPPAAQEELNAILHTGPDMYPARPIVERRAQLACLLKNPPSRSGLVQPWPDAPASHYSAASA